MATVEGLILRPVRPADRERIEEISAGVWEGRDYIPRVFDRWVHDAGASFQAAEIDGVVVGVQRLRPYAPGLMWYEGLRVATPHQRQGIARAMLASAVEEAREQRFRELRLATRDGPAIRLFETAGFRLLNRARWWRASRVEGGDPARMPEPAEARRLWAWMSSSAGVELYGGVSADMNGAHDLGPDELERLASEGMLRVGAGGRAIAFLREPWANNVAVAVITGQGGALRDLLMALRFEADADAAEHVTVNLPLDHPAEEDLRASGYDFADDEPHAYVYGLTL